MSSPNTSEIEAAVAALRRGECVGLPTETVYGLAADARNPAAVRRIFALKGRPADHPLIVHLPAASFMNEFAADVPDTARRLAERFWPGPLTLILQRAPGVPDEVTGGQDTVGLRVPAHPVARAVLLAFNGGLAAPSANRFGRISPTRAEHVRAEFGDAVPIVLDGGSCEVGIESTIVDLSGAHTRILRPGAILPEQIESVIGALDDSAGQAPRVSGSLDRHYAPRTPLRLADRTTMIETADSAVVLALDTMPARCTGVTLERDPVAYARRLYAALRDLDGCNAAQILVEIPPRSPEWDAIHDRLQRAAAGSDSSC
ncbi:MAG TPA: L-threonylcarbamoyladenylate synthase [Xanthomonadaceae bacterium]|nr:L-threonylcarbamoyladenylate synthase [Xanthomonadaceae bacterium]